MEILAEDSSAWIASRARSRPGDALESRSPATTPTQNVHPYERIASALVGTALVTGGLLLRSLGGAALVVAGSGLLARGVRGRSRLYRALGIDTAHADVAEHRGTGEVALAVERSVTISRSADELFAFVRDPAHFALVTGSVAEAREPLPGHVEVELHAPLGPTVTLETRIVEERPPELLRWASRENAELPSAGAFHFRPAPGDRGTEVTLRLAFAPPGGRLTATALEMLGDIPGVLAQRALRRFKSLVETGEIPTTGRNPSARAV